MKKISIAKAIVKYRPSPNGRDFVQGNLTRNNASSRYLLLQKASDKFYPENIEKWEFVGGRINSGETSRRTIERELEEETGLKMGTNARIVKQLPTLTMKDEKYESTCDVYFVETSSMEVRLSKEHKDYIWKRAEEVRDMDLVLYADLLLEFFNNPEKYFS